MSQDDLIILRLLFDASAIALASLFQATTALSEKSGLLAGFQPPFESANNCKTNIISVGTGKTPNPEG